MNRVYRVLFSILVFLIIATNPFVNLYGQTDNAAELFLVAQKAFDDGFYDVAIRYLTQYLEKYPTERQAQAKLLLGQCYYFKGQYLKAFEIFKEQLNQKDFRDIALFWLGETHFKGKDYQQAEKSYKQLLKEFPDSFYAPQARYSLGWVYFAQNRFEDAIKYFQDFLKRYPKHQLAEDASFKIAECRYDLKDYLQAIKAFREFLQTYPHSKNHAQAYFYIGESFYYQKNYTQAIDYYRKAFDLAEKDSLKTMIKVSMGWSYFKLDDLERALKNFDEAEKIAIDAKLPSDEIDLGKGTLLYEMKRYPDALKTYDHLIHHYPNSPRLPEALLGKANVLSAMGKYAEAEGLYHKIIKTYNTQRRKLVEKAYFGLAWMFLKKGDMAAGIQAFRDVMKYTHDDIVKLSALTQIGDTYQDAKKYDQAIEIYDEILKKFPDSPYTDYIQYRQGIALLKKGNIEGATLAFTTLAKNFPNSKYLNDTRYYLGLAYFKRENWSQAKKSIEEFMKNLSPQSEYKADALYILASSLFNLGEYTKAMSTFQEIVKNFSYRKKLSRDSEIGIAKCLYERGETKEALKRFKIIAYKYPQTETEMEVLLWLSDYYIGSNNYENAILYLKQILKHFPGSDNEPLVRYKLGQAYASLGKFDEALKQFKIVTRSENKTFAAKAQLAIANIFSQKVEPQSAIETYQQIADNSPDFKKEALMKIAQLYIDQKKYKEAIETFKKALKAPSSQSSQISKAEIQFRIGDTFELMNKPNLAIETYLKIPYLYPQEKKWIIKAYLRMARIFEDEEDWENAKLVYNKIIDYGTEEVKFAQERLEWIKNNIDNKPTY